MGGEKQKRKSVEGGLKSSDIIQSGIFPAEILEIVAKVGTKQGGTQVRCKILSGSDEGKIMRRNVSGPVRVGDTLILRETEIEAMQLRAKGGRKAQ